MSTYATVVDDYAGLLALRTGDTIDMGLFSSRWIVSDVQVATHALAATYGAVTIWAAPEGTDNVHPFTLWPTPRGYRIGSSGGREIRLITEEAS